MPSTFPAKTKKPNVQNQHTSPLDVDKAHRAVDLISQGMSTRNACQEVGMPQSTLLVAISRDSAPGLRNLYAQARESQADAWLNEMRELGEGIEADLERYDPKAWNAVVQARRLRLDTTKWMIARMHPSKYGDNLGTQANAQPIAIQLITNVVGPEIPTRKARPVNSVPTGRIEQDGEVIDMTGEPDEAT